LFRIILDRKMQEISDIVVAHKNPENWPCYTSRAKSETIPRRTPGTRNFCV